MSDIDFDVIDIRYNLIIYSKWGSQGVIDVIGNEVVPRKYETIHFDDVPNSFIVADEDYEQRYDSLGRKVSAFNSSLITLNSKYIACGDFHDGLAPVAKASKDRNGQESLSWGYINTNGKEIIPCGLAKAYKFSCGLARVNDGNLYGFIDKSGATKIPMRYIQASDFINGYASMKALRIPAAVINVNGEIVCKIDSFYKIDGFYDGLARVQSLHQRFGFYNVKGELVIPFVFESATNFSGGISKVIFAHGAQREQVFRIDTMGNLVISNQGKDYTIKVDLYKFSGIGPFINGIAEISYWHEHLGYEGRGLIRLVLCNT